MLLIGMSAFSGGLTKPKSSELRDLDQLTFETYAVDFGTVTRGETREYNFKFTNHGKEDVRLLGIHAPCSCTLAQLKNDSIAPGASGAIQMTFDSSHHRGKLVKTLFVLTDEKIIPERILTITADIVEEFSVNPPVADFGDLSKALLPKTLTVEIVPLNNQPFQITKVDFDPDSLQVKYSFQGQKAVLSITLLKQQSSGSLRKTIEVHNNSAHLAKLPIPIVGHIASLVKYAPEYIDFGSLAGGETIIKNVQLKSSQPFTVDKGRIAADLLLNGEPVDDWRQIIEFTSQISQSSTQGSIGVLLKHLNPVYSGSLHGQVYFYTKDNNEKVAVDVYAMLLKSAKHQ